MGNGVSTDQGNLPTHDKRNVSQSVDEEQYDWLEQAEAPETNSLLSTGKPYITTMNSHLVPLAGSKNRCETTKSLKIC